jgi:thiamine biosynthesis protein ThiS
MKLVINGEERAVPDVAHLAALIEALEMKPDRVAVELNRDIVPRGKWAETPVREGDKLEIVHFVGGGKGICNF